MLNLRCANLRSTSFRCAVPRHPEVERGIHRVPPRINSWGGPVQTLKSDRSDTPIRTSPLDFTHPPRNPRKGQVSPPLQPSGVRHGTPLLGVRVSRRRRAQHKPHRPRYEGRCEGDALGRLTHQCPAQAQLQGQVLGFGVRSEERSARPFGGRSGRAEDPFGRCISSTLPVPLVQARYIQNIQLHYDTSFARISPSIPSHLDIFVSCLSNGPAYPG